MSILKVDKILRSQDQSILVDSVGNSTKILHIDTDLQTPNRIFKDGSNLVSQITDKAQNIAFIADVGKEYTFNYGGYFEGDGTKKMRSTKRISDINTFTFRWVSKGVSSGGANLFVLSANLDWYLNQAGNIINLYDGTTTHSLFAGSYGIDIYNLFELCYDGTNCVLLINGAVKSKSTPSIATLSSSEKLSIFSYQFNDTANLNGSFKQVQIYDRSIYDLANLNVSDVIHQTTGENFTYIWYKRYKPDGYKKLFLSSRYLKDATINSSDEISTIYPEIGDVLINNLAEKPTLTKGSIYFGNTSGLRFLEAGRLDFSSNDFYCGLWVKYSAFNTVNGFIGNDDQPNNDSGLVIQYYKTTNEYWVLLSNTGSSFDQIATFSFTETLDTYVYVAVMRKSDTLYFYRNGILLGTYALPEGYDIFYSLDKYLIGSRSRPQPNFMHLGHIDDFLVSIGDSIIDPTGKSIGEKVFEPPRRRSLESEFIQF